MKYLTGEAPRLGDVARYGKREGVVTKVGHFFIRLDFGPPGRWADRLMDHVWLLPMTTELVRRDVGSVSVTKDDLVQEVILDFGNMMEGAKMMTMGPGVNMAILSGKVASVDEADRAPVELTLEGFEGLDIWFTDADGITKDMELGTEVLVIGTLYARRSRDYSAVNLVVLQADELRRL